MRYYRNRKPSPGEWLLVQLGGLAVCIGLCGFGGLWIYEMAHLGRFLVASFGLVIIGAGLAGLWVLFFAKPSQETPVTQPEVALVHRSSKPSSKRPVEPEAKESRAARAPLSTLLVGELVQPFTRHVVLVGFSLEVSRTEAQRLASLLAEDGADPREKARSLSAAALETGWYGHKLIKAPSEADALRQKEDLASAMETRALGYRDESTPVALLTWLQVLEVTGALPKSPGTSAAELQRWLEDVLPSALTRVITAQTIVSTPRDRASVESFLGGVTDLHP